MKKNIYCRAACLIKAGLLEQRLIDRSKIMNRVGAYVAYSGSNSEASTKRIHATVRR